MLQMLRLLLLPMMLLCSTHLVMAEADLRMQVDVAANEEKGISVAFLRSNIKKAANLALPTLWDRLVPTDEQRKIPANVKATRFLQKVTPTATGARISFNPRRVIAYLEKHEVTYIKDLPQWTLSVQLSNTTGRSMPQSAALLKDYAHQTSHQWGYLLDAGPSLVLHWQWQDNSQVTLMVRGTSSLGEISETRFISSGDPFKELQPWLQEVLLKARDATVLDQTLLAAAQLPDATVELPLEPLPRQEYLLLRIEREATLLEQVLFEEELRRDSRIIDLTLNQVNLDGQQYRLHLKGADDQWLAAWFARRGLTLTPTIEGWVVR